MHRGCRPLPVTELRVRGRALVTRRAVAEIVSGAVSGSYGVTGLGRGPLDRLRATLGLGAPGVLVRVEPRLEVDLFLSVAFGVPVAEVAHNVESAVRFAVQQALGRDVDELHIHVHGLRLAPRARGGRR